LLLVNIGKHSTIGGGGIIIIQQQEGCNAHETQGMNFIVSMGDIIKVHVLEVKATSEAILLKHLSGAKLAKEDQNKKKRPMSLY
jgi:hypothetical protein